MRRCIVHLGRGVFCGQPAKKLGIAALCADHWPAVVS